MRRIKKLGALSAVALAVGLTFTAAAPAQAGVGECASGRFCLWENNDQNGYIFGNANNVTYVGAAANDRASSIYNNGNTCSVRFYSDQSYGGYSGDLSRGYTYNRLASWFVNPVLTFDNLISSFRWFC